MEVRRPEFDEARAMMSAAAQDGPEFGVSRVGAELRAARLRLGWSLEEVAQGLRIRLPFLEAIEDGRVGDLPGAAYAVGFVRTYAGALGLDPDEVSRRFRAEAQQVNCKTELSFPAPVPERGVPPGAVVLLGLVLAIGAYAAWYNFSAGRHDAGGVGAVPERLASLADRGAPSHVSPQAASILPLASSAAAAPVPAALAPAAAPMPADASRVALKFRADSFIQVREKQGSVLLSRVMHAGETWVVPKEADLVMTTGNAGGTDIVVDGITAAPLGANGTVRRDVPLDPEAIKLRPGVKLPPQPRSQ